MKPTFIHKDTGQKMKKKKNTENVFTDAKIKTTLSRNGHVVQAKTFKNESIKQFTEKIVYHVKEQTPATPALVNLAFRVMSNLS